MASFFRRKRGLIFKFVIGVPILWFAAILLLTYQGSWDPPLRDRGKRNIDLNKKSLHVPVQGGIDSLGHDRKIHEEEEQQIRQKVEEERLFKEREERERRNIELIEKQKIEEMKKNPVLKFEPEHKEEKIKVDPNAPGEQGRAVEIDKEKLSPEERKKYDDGWQRNAFNEYASNMISLHRSLPDVRDEECKTQKYRDNLPDTSVVVCFHNEAWSVLLRTVHSIIDRSPPHLLKEVILVDDFSDMDHLKKPLEDYVAKLRNVKVVRTKQREGLIRARLLGYSASTGTVLTYLDSHCECAEGWLEPILDRIAEDKRHVVTPVIESIIDDTLQFKFSKHKDIQVGRFDWSLTFNWMPVSDAVKKTLIDKSTPIRFVWN